jgi:hypothetical protein
MDELVASSYTFGARKVREPSPVWADDEAQIKWLTVKNPEYVLGKPRPK